jgi:outer membrane immunogenic protein
MSKPVLVAALLLASTAAYAADLPTKEPAATRTDVFAQRWTGFYAGVGGGYSWGNVKLGSFSNPDAAALHPRGYVFAASVGYDYQFANNIVLGARLTAPFASAHDSTFSTVAGRNIEARAKYAFIVSGRVGYAMGNVLPYGMAGFVVARGEANTPGCCSAQATHSGSLIGGGVDYAFAPHWSLDVNFTYLSLNTRGYDVTPFGGAVVDYGYNAKNLMAGLHYRF